MPLRLRVIPSTRGAAGDGRGPTAERAIEFADDVTEIRIGRRPDLELPLPFTILSSVHARLVRGQGSAKSTVKGAGKVPKTDGWMLEDLGSRNGTFLAGERLRAGEKRPISAGAHISLAHVDIVFEGPSVTASGSEGTGTIARRLVSDLFAAGAESSAPTVVVVSGANTRGVLRLEERDRKYILGRVESCDLQLAVEEISREHAAFVRRWDGVFVSDLGSKNGVRVSGVLAERQRVRDGDLIQIGPVSLRLFDPEDRYLREFEARSDGAAALEPADAPSPTGAPGPAGVPGAPGKTTPGKAATAAPRADLHPAIAGALAADPADKSASVVERTNFSSSSRGGRVATLVAAVVLAIIAAVAVIVAFG